MIDRVNICFHGVGTPKRPLEKAESRYWITTDTFLRILDDVAGLQKGRAAISFDDGNLSDVEIGLPALQERGLEATFFVLAGRLDEPGSLQPEHVRHLLASGMDVGTHGMHHVPWPGLDERSRHVELVEARDVLQATTGTPIEQAALPLGRYDRHVLSELSLLRYRRVFSSDRRWARPDSWLQPRFSARAEDTPESFRRLVLTRPARATQLVGEMKSLVKRVL